MKNPQEARWQAEGRLDRGLAAIASVALLCGITALAAKPILAH